ncbi:MAG: hypothetical protein K0S79_1927 [Nitrospira sp.]|nr:hypothetical protein [Nitrospira sp.]
MKCIEIGQSVVHGRLPIGMRKRKTLGIRNGHQLHVSIFPKDWTQFRQIQASMQGGEHGGWTTTTQGKTQKVEMRMDNVKLIGVGAHGMLLHQNQRRVTIDQTSAQTQCVRASRFEAC